MKYIEGTLVKSSGKISREHKKLLVRKKVNFKVKCDRKRCKSNNLLHKHLLVKN